MKNRSRSCSMNVWSLTGIALLIGFLYVRCSPKVDPDSSAAELKEDVAEENVDDIQLRTSKMEYVIGRLIEAYIVEELVAKNISVGDLCDRLNVLLKNHLSSTGLANLGFERIEAGEIASGEKVFFHVRRVSVKAILNLACEQLGLRYDINGGVVTVDFIIETD